MFGIIFFEKVIMMERIVLHIDVNSAFLSWSALKLLEEGYESKLVEGSTTDYIVTKIA